jgi:hypothetical protein
MSRSQSGGKRKLDISDTVFKVPTKAIKSLNRLSSGEDHENDVELIDGKVLEFARIKSHEIGDYYRNMDNYRYYMVTGCMVTEINPPLPHPDIVGKFK